MMNLIDPQLKAFMAVAKYKTVHAAAEMIFLTQTAVTQRIHGLENRLKTSLFIRSRRGMALTPDGEALLRYCYAVQELEGNTLSKICKSGIETEVSVGINAASSIMQSRIIPQCLPVMSRFENLLMRFEMNDVENRHLSLRAGERQLAVLQPEQLSKEFCCKPLKPENYLLVCSAKWKKRTLKEILQQERIVDFDPLDQLTFKYLQHFDLFQWARQDRYFVNRTESIAQMVAGGYGYSLLTKEFAEPYVKTQQLMVLNKGQRYENAVYLAWYDRPQLPAYFSALIKAII